MFEWWLGSDGITYERQPVPARIRSLTLDKYSEQQKHYDPFFNEWDCCASFEDSDTQSLDKHSEDAHKHPQGNTHKHSSKDTHKYPQGKDRYPKDDNEDREPIVEEEASHLDNEDREPIVEEEASHLKVHLNPSMTPHDCSLAELDSFPDKFALASWYPGHGENGTKLEPSESLECAFGESFGMFYGFYLPAAGCHPQTLDDGEKGLELLSRLIGERPKPLDQTSAFLLGPMGLAAQHFVLGVNRRASNFLGTWDMKDECPRPVHLTPRFSGIEVISSPPKPIANRLGLEVFDNVDVFYVFSFPTSCAKLACISATAALLVCRLSDQFNLDDTAFYLVQRGVPFRIFYPSTSLPKPPPLPPRMPLALPVRLANHTFTRADYDQYLQQRILVLSQPHMQAALKRGGIIWRLAIGDLGLSSVSQPPSHLGSTRSLNVRGVDYLENSLTMVELDLLCGAYECISGM